MEYVLTPLVTRFLRQYVKRSSEGAGSNLKVGAPRRSPRSERHCRCPPMLLPECPVVTLQPQRLAKAEVTMQAGAKQQRHLLRALNRRRPSAPLLPAAGVVQPRQCAHAAQP